jgi:hypothetical protein
MAKGYNKNQGSRFSDGIVSEGHITLNGSLWLPDVAVDTGPNDEDPGRIYFGNGNDMNISVSGSKHGVVRQVNTDGSLYLQSANINGGEVIISNNGASEILARFKNGPDVTTGDNQYVAGCFLYHNNSAKFSTRSYGAEISGTAKVKDAQVVGQPFVDNAKLRVAEIEFSEGTNTNDGAAIRFVSTGTDNNKSALDIRIDDDPSDTAANADKIRFRLDPSPEDINGGSEYSLVEISAKRNGSTRMDLTTLVMDSGETRTSEVIADTFTGEASTVAALDNAAGTLTTDHLTQGITNKYFSTAQVDTHISVTTGDASGGGSLSYTTGTFTFAPAQLASTTAAGIASFSSNDFAVSAAGAVTLNSLKNGDIASDAAIAYSKLANVSANTIVGNNTASAAGAKFLTKADMISFLDIAEDADKYGGWNINHTGADGADGTATEIGSGNNVKFVGSGATTITRSSGAVTITSANDNTEYSTDTDYGTTMSGTTIRLANDRRRNANTDVKSGNKHDYTWYDIDVGIRWYVEEAEEMRLKNNGDLHVNGDIIAYSTTVSDERLKKNIQVVDGALNKVSQLKGVTFDWKQDNTASAGLIAQDVEKVLSSAIKEKTLPFKTDDNEVYKTVEYSQVTALLVEAIKELKEQNTQLRADIEELKNINNR